MFAILDERIRNIISYVYRAILVLYSLSIIFYNLKNNYFQLVWYFVFLAMYYILFVVAKQKFKKSGFRLILDYGIIVIVLYEKDLSNTINYFLLLLPLFNSPNYSGSKKNYSVYAATIISVLVLGYKSGTYILLPIIPIFFIDLSLRLRESVKRLNDTLFNIMDKFYAQNIGKKESSKIYETLLKQFSKSSYTRELRIDTIICFIPRKSELILVNSNKFILTFSFADQKKIIDYLSKNNVKLSEQITIDGHVYKDSIFVKTRGNNRDYIFLIPFSKLNSIQYFRLSLIGNFLLVPFFKHLARLFETRYQILQQRRKNLNSFQDNKEYILKANEVMHFVKNSLSPIKSALTISEMYFDSPAGEDKNYLKETFIKQRKQALLEIQNITNRSDFILEKNKNPFESTNFSKISVSNLVNAMRRIWTETNSPSNIQYFLYDKINLDVMECDMDMDTFYLIVHNVISNTSKYGNDDCQLKFEFKLNQLVICFQNIINLPKADLEKLKRDVDNYNKNLRIEIFKRKSHGFAHLKLYTESIGAESNIEIRENYFIFNLIIKTT